LIGKIRKNAKPPERVAAAVERQLTRRRMRARTLVGADARSILAMKALLPARGLDAVLDSGHRALSLGPGSPSRRSVHDRMSMPFEIETKASPEQVRRALTDFTRGRLRIWNARVLPTPPDGRVGRMHAIRAAHAFDGTGFLPGGATVLVDGDRIVGVETGRMDVPAGVEVVDYDGTVLPGLVDCHTHLVADATFGGLERAGAMTDEAIDAVIADSLAAHAAAGVTTVRDLGDRGYRTLAVRELLGLPRVVASGPPLTTHGGHCHFLGGEVDGDPRAAVAEHVERGVDVIKVMASGGFATPNSDQLGAQFTVAELAAIVEAAHGAGLPVVAHAHSLAGMRNALAAGVDGIEHFTGLSSQGAVIGDDVLEDTARRSVYVDLTTGNDRALHALMPAPPPPVAALMARFGVASFDEFYAARIGMFRRLRDHGVAVVAGVDSGMGPPKRHGNAWRVVADQVEGGWPVAEALASATSLAAEACGLGGETGRLAAGHAADVLVVDGDLAEDVTVLGSPREILVRGTRIDSRAGPSRQSLESS
jgi:imidazolonepropionase-like amidohydrolase